MLIKKKDPSEPGSSEITPESIYMRRRSWLQLAGASAGALAAGLVAPGLVKRAEAALGPSLSARTGSPYSTTDETKTPFEDATTYNNFYEFGTDKSDPAANAHTLRTSPWTVQVGGHCAKPGKYALEAVLKPHALEERIYRLRCVEAWSMVIPWIGIPAAALLKRFEPTSKAKYIKLTTLLDPEQMPGQKRSVLDWPYEEGLRIDEAMNPLTLFAVGMYGKVLPNQNGAPLRLVVPWKYGFKWIKSIVAIDFVDREPVSSWMASSPREYGFYSNVNPDVPHPRWSQALERRIGEFRKRRTLAFNGYGEHVAHLYAGMDLRKHF